MQFTVFATQNAVQIFQIALINICCHWFLWPSTGMCGSYYYHLYFYRPLACSFVDFWRRLNGQSSKYTHVDTYMYRYVHIYRYIRVSSLVCLGHVHGGKRVQWGNHM